MVCGKDWKRAAGAVKTFDKSRISRQLTERVVRFVARIVEIEYGVGEVDDISGVICLCFSKFRTRTIQKN